MTEGGERIWWIFVITMCPDAVQGARPVDVFVGAGYVDHRLALAREAVHSLDLCLNSSLGRMWPNFIPAIMTL